MRDEKLKGTTREDMARDTMVPGEEWYKKIDQARKFGMQLLKRSDDIKLPTVSADTDIEYALPYSAWHGPAPSIQKALETDKNIVG